MVIEVKRFECQENKTNEVLIVYLNERGIYIHKRRIKKLDKTDL